MPNKRQNLTDQSTTTDTFISHLQELRKCLVRATLGLIVCFAACAWFAKDIYNLLAYPLQKVLPKGSSFIATHPFEAWLTYLKTALLAAFFIALPYIFWQIWSFVGPALYKKEKKYALAFVALTSFFFIAGAFFGYFYVFPYAFEFFTGIMENTEILFLPQMKEYLGFVFKLLLAFGVIFELPILVFILGISGIVSIKALFGFQKYMIVLAFFISALLTPPDVITQIMMGLPVIFLYEVGLVCAWIVKRDSPNSL